MLLKLQTYACRLNFAREILEQEVWKYRHLKSLLVRERFSSFCLSLSGVSCPSQKPLPLDTPVVLALTPDKHIQVTLFDANHCPGSVMFCEYHQRPISLSLTGQVFEGDGKAVLYTGDTRSEPWFVNSLLRNPCLIRYCGGIKTLDKIYLDTSFLENVPFQTKAEGIQELLRKVAEYPEGTVFHFQAWTYG